MICPKCGAEIPEESEFCNKCGTRLQTEDNQTNIIIEDEQPEKLHIDKKDNIVKNKKLKITKLKDILKNKRALIPILIICCLVVITTITYLVIKPPSTDKVFNKVKNYSADDASDYLNKVYPNNGGFLGIFKKQNKDNRVAVLTMMINQIDDNFKSTTGRSISDYQAVKITNVSIGGYSGDYANINITINNGGTTPINYIKVNLFFKDKNGNIVRSDWTNDDSNIQPGANQILTKMTKRGDWYTVSAEIAEIR